MHAVKSLLALFSIAMIVGLSACDQTNERYTDQIQSLDSLATELQQAHDTFMAMDTTGIHAMAIEQSKNLKIISEYYKDTMDRENAVMLSQYRGLKKGFKGFDHRYQHYKKQLEYSIQQVDNLRNDLKNGVVAVNGEENSLQSEHENAMTPEDRADLYYQNEMEAGTRLCSEISTWVQMASNARTHFKEMNPQVEEIIAHLKTKGEDSRWSDGEKRLNHIVIDRLDGSDGLRPTL